jgi:hypothetical protein
MMRVKKYILILGVAAIFVSCKTEQPPGNPLEKVLASTNPKIKRVMDSLDRYEVQIRYTQIDRRNDSILFTDYDFQVNSNNYFYPASTVKFPIAVLAMERLNQTDTLNRDIRFYVEGDTVESTFATDILKIFAVSDNDANNRLLEFLGQDAINKGLAEKGIGPVRISHRLGVHSDDMVTKPLIIHMNDTMLGTTLPTYNSAPMPLALQKIKKGNGYYEEDSLIHQPFDFSLKNYYPVDAQYGVLKRIIFPEQFPEEQRFDLSGEQRDFLLTAMHTLPRHAGYDPVEYYDGYCKFFMFGDTKENIPEQIKIYNKVGFAYGTLTDCAYIVDPAKGVEFMLTATILVNKDGIFNDDHYEYEEVGIPFLAELGRGCYDYELNRKK